MNGRNEDLREIARRIGNLSDRLSWANIWLAWIAMEITVLVVYTLVKDLV